MQIVLRKNNYEDSLKDIYVIDDEKTLIFAYAGTGDLHWIIINEGDITDDCTFIFNITKENYELYNSFEILFEDIKNINIYDDSSIDFVNEEEYKERFKKYNNSHYNDLYDEETDTITWVSDETGYQVANILKIKKFNDKFVVQFLTQQYIEGYEREYNLRGMRGIRFRNSGSRYTPFNAIFMRMYFNIQNITDINEFGHQIHMEEYLYQKKLSNNIH